MISVGGGVALRGSGQALGNSYDANFQQKQIHRTNKATIGTGRIIINGEDKNASLRINRDVENVQVITKHRNIEEIRVRYTKVDWNQLLIDIGLRQEMHVPVPHIAKQARNNLDNIAQGNVSNEFEEELFASYNKFTQMGYSHNEALNIIYKNILIPLMNGATPYEVAQQTHNPTCSISAAPSMWNPLNWIVNTAHADTFLPNKLCNADIVIKGSILDSLGALGGFIAKNPSVKLLTALTNNGTLEANADGTYVFDPVGFGEYTVAKRYNESDGIVEIYNIATGETIIYSDGTYWYDPISGNNIIGVGENIGLDHMAVLAVYNKKDSSDSGDTTKGGSYVAMPPMPDCDKNPELCDDDLEDIAREYGVPKDWKKQDAKGNGIAYVNPRNPHDRVRIMRGKGPNSAKKWQRNTYIARQRNGQRVDKNGNPVKPRSEEAHINPNGSRFVP